MRSEKVEIIEDDDTRQIPSERNKQSSSLLPRNIMVPEHHHREQ